MQVFDALIRVAGGCVAALLGAMIAMFEATATPYTWAMPVAAALVGNVLLFFFAQYTVAKTWAWIVPAVPWFLVMIISVGSTSEGDLIANSWTGLATFGFGAAGFFMPAAFVPAGFWRPSKAPRLLDAHRQETEGVRPEGG